MHRLGAVTIWAEEGLAGREEYKHMCQDNDGRRTFFF